MTVRRARPSDALGIATVHVASWEATYRGLMPDPLLDQMTVERRTRSWTQLLAADRDGETFVAVDDERIIGFADVGPARAAEDGTGEVYAIYVDPDAWDRGHGRDLMVRSLDWLRRHGYTAAILRVLDGNDRGRSFYERGGWQVTGDVVIADHCGAPLPELTYRTGLVEEPPGGSG